MRTMLGIFTASLLAIACGDDPKGGDAQVCTGNIVSIRVEVVAPDDLVIDRVTVENAEVEDCAREDGETGPRSGSGVYICNEQAGGAYDFVVESGQDSFTQSAVFEYDGCHLVDPEDIVFDITGQ